MSRTVNLTASGMATTKMACNNSGEASKVYNWQLLVISALDLLVNAKIKTFKMQDRINISDEELQALAVRSITGTQSREDLKGKLATQVTTWSIIGWNVGTKKEPEIEYHLTDISVDIVAS